MTTGAPPIRAPSQVRAPAWIGYVATALASALLGLALGLVLARVAQPDLALVLAGGIGMLCVLALALARHEAAVALGIVLLGVVLVEPAPSDLVLLAVIAVAVATRRFTPRHTPAPVLALLLGFATLNLMSAIQVEDPELAALYVAITLYLMTLAVWLSGYVGSPDHARVVVRAYVATAVASAAAGVLALAVPVPGSELLADGGRARALFQDPNVFGPFLIPALLIVLEEILQPRLLRSRRSVKALMLAALALGVVFSFSRGAWLNVAVALIVMSVVLVFRRGGGRRALALIAVVSAAAAGAAAIVVATESGDFLTERARTQAYDSERFAAQRAALGPAEAYPFGAGPGQFEGVAGMSAHSTYARALGEQGFPGLVVVLALLGWTLLYAARNAIDGRSTFGIGSASLLAAWSGLLVSSAFVDTLHWRHLWLVAALIWAGEMLRRRPQRSATALARRGVHAGSA